MRMLHIVLIALLFISGCSPQNESRSSSFKEDDPIQISFSTDGKERDTSGAFVIEINSNLIVNYYGGSKSELAGNYFGKISRSKWNKLLEIIDKKNIIDTILPETSTDDDFFDLSIRFHNKKHYISGYYSNAPNYVRDLCEEMILIKNKIKFKEVSFDKTFEVKAYKTKRSSDNSFQFTVPKVAP